MAQLIGVRCQVSGVRKMRCYILKPEHLPARRPIGRRRATWNQTWQHVVSKKAWGPIVLLFCALSFHLWALCYYFFIFQSQYHSGNRWNFDPDICNAADVSCGSVISLSLKSSEISKDSRRTLKPKGLQNLVFTFSFNLWPFPFNPWTLNQWIQNLIHICLNRCV